MLVDGAFSFRAYYIVWIIGEDKLKDVAKVNVDSGSYEVKDNVLYINGTLNSVKNLFFELENSVQLKGDYTIKNNYENLSENVININLRDGNHSSNFVLSFNNNTANYKTEKNLNFVAKYFYVQLNVGTYNHFQIKLKLEEGTEATSYSPYRTR